MKAYASICAAVALALCGSTPAFARGSRYVTDCSAHLVDHWRQDVAAHPVDLARHIPVLSINVPIPGAKLRYRGAIAALKQAFPTFEEGQASGILAGCCAIPVWGSVSPEELTKLSEAQFVPLCMVARRSRSTAAGVRMEFRETYLRGEGGEAYFFTYWHREPHP